MAFTRYEFVAELWKRQVDAAHITDQEYAPGTSVKLVNAVDSDPMDITTRYIQAEYNDASELLKALYKTSRPSSRAVAKLIIEHDIEEEFRFGASISLQGGVPCVQYSRGMFFALDDLFMRLCSNNNFFSWDPARVEHVWTECGCMWIGDNQYVIRPNRRYYDYNAHISEEAPFGIHPLSLFFYVLPLGDLQRIDLCKSLYKCAILWVMMHEECHFFGGHLSLLGSNNQSIAIDEVRTIPIKDDLLFKTMEWEADRNGVESALDVLLPGVRKLLPGYCSNDMAWSLRLIFVSIGCTALIFHKARLFGGPSSTHPAPFTRIVTTIYGIGKRLHEKNVHVSDNDLFNSVLGTLSDIWFAQSIIFSESDINIDSPDPKTTQERFGQPGMLPGDLALLDNEVQRDSVALYLFCRLKTGFFPELSNGLYNKIKDKMFFDDDGNPKPMLNLEQFYPRFFEEFDTLSDFHQTHVYALLKGHRIGE